MWFFLFGNKGYYDHLGYIIMKCPDCETRGVFSVEQERKKFTIYLIPTFQYSKKQFMVCTTCHQRFEVAEELKPELAKRLISQEELSSLIRQRRLKESAIGSGERQLVAADTEHRCPSCENKITDKMVYCPQCGRKLK